jgi:hypothetical protein
MDVTTLDLLNARVVIELELEDVKESLSDQLGAFLRGQVEGFQARRDELLAQLEVINTQLDNDEADKDNESPLKKQKCSECDVEPQEQVGRSLRQTI